MEGGNQSNRDAGYVSMSIVEEDRLEKPRGRIGWKREYVKGWE